MKLQRVAKTLIAAAAVIFANAALADVVVTKSGARLLGTVAKIDGANVTLKTDYAGEIKIKQSEVASIETDEPITVRLSGGTTMAGTVSTSPEGTVVISGADGSINTTVDKVAMTWAPGAADPAIDEGRRKWAYEAGVDITGKSGNRDQLGTALNASATLQGPTDKLMFYTGYNRQETDEVKSADQFEAGIDYSNNFSGRYSWYVRTEGGFDRVKDVELYNVSAFGVGYDAIKNPRQTLTFRSGISYRYEGYETPLVEDVNSAGLDFGVMHTYKFATALMKNSISYVPSFDDFGNYRAIHDSSFEMPLLASRWKLRIGVNNDYTSEPSPGLEEMDTTYYTRFILSWQ